MPRKSKTTREATSVTSLTALLKQARQVAKDMGDVAGDPASAALHETTAEVLQGLVRAHEHYARKSEPAWQGAGEQSEQDGQEGARQNSVASNADETAQSLKDQQAGRRTITREELRNRMDAGKPTVIYDLRTQNAWNASESKLPGAIRIPAEGGAPAESGAQDGSMIVVYDSDGAAEIGYAAPEDGSNLAEAALLEGGFDAWQAADFPLENKTVEEKRLELETEA